jgi:hypothetical protein
VTAAKTAGICLALAGIALAGSSFRIGTKLTWHGDAGSTMWYDENDIPTVEVSYGEAFGGFTAEATYGPVWGLSGRIDIGQVGFPMSGRSFRLFPTLGLDLMFEPPTEWRAKPYIWGGARMARYYGVPSEAAFLLMDDDGTRVRAGLGAKLRLSHVVEFFAEGQIFTHDSRWNGTFNSGGGQVRAVDEKPADFRMASLELGARFALGK